MGHLLASNRRNGASKKRSHATGMEEGCGFLTALQEPGGTRFDLSLRGGEGEGNRTLMASLEG
jgi:hypothetical protein